MRAPACVGAPSTSGFYGARQKLQDQRGMAAFDTYGSTQAEGSDHRTIYGSRLWTRPQQLFGYPIFIADDMPDLVNETASSSIAFGNFGEAYQIDVRILRDPYSTKPYVEFYTTRRVGGAVVNFEAIKIGRFEK